MFGEYAELAKWSIYLAILTALIALGNQVVTGLIEYGYNQHVIEAASESVRKDQTIRKKLIELRKVAENVPEPITVTETIETVKYVDKIINKTIFKCDDISDYSRVRYETRSCIYAERDSRRECFNNGTLEVQ